MDTNEQMAELEHGSQRMIDRYPFRPDAVGVFDPEQIERYLNSLVVPARALGGTTPKGFSTAKVDGVRASDYDQLLALYREAVKDSEDMASRYSLRIQPK